jgi:hypothetical protein
VKAAVGHYQFETLHPFSDGNGRLGRLVVVLQMIEAGTLDYPVLNLSPWLRARKAEYKDQLLRVSETGDYEPWVRFFCTAVEAQAQDMVSRIEELLAVLEEMLGIVRAHRLRGTSVSIVDDLIGYSSITPSAAAKLHNVTYKAANDAIRKLEGPRVRSTQSQTDHLPIRLPLLGYECGRRWSSAAPFAPRAGFIRGRRGAPEGYAASRTHTSEAALERRHGNGLKGLPERVTPRPFG